MLPFFLRTFLAFSLLGFLSWATPLNLAKPVQAGAPTLWNNAILPEDFSLGLFGANRQFVDLRAGVRNLAETMVQMLSSGVTDGTVMGVSNLMDSGTVDGLFVFYADNNSGSGNFDMYLSTVDASGSEYSTVLVYGGGGIGGFHGQSGFLKMVPDDNRGVYLMYFTGAESGFGPVNVQLTHFDEFGTESGAFPIDLGEYNSDMISDGFGGIFVLSEIGRDRDFLLPFTHGIVARYTSAGVDATWAGGAGEFTVSDNVASEKYGATLMSDGAGGGIVLWVEDDAYFPVIRGQRFLGTGLAAPGWITFGDVLYTTPGPLDFNFVRGASSGFGKYYATFSESFGNIKTISFDENGDARWSCTQDLGTATYYTAIGNEHPYNPGVYVITDDGGAKAQHYEESNGNSTWALGGENVASGTDFNLVFPDQGFTWFFENKSRGMAIDPVTYMVDLLYAISDFGDLDVFDAQFDRSTFPAGPGGDCAAGAVPDAIIDLTAVAGNAEVDLDWTAPADNGDPIIDYTIEYRTPAGAGPFTVFVDGVNTNTEVTVTGLTNGEEYDFRVFAENGVGLSAASNIATATPTALGGRRRASEVLTTKGPQLYLGKLQQAIQAVLDLLSPAAIDQDGGDGGVYGASGADDEASFQQSEDFSTRSFSSDPIFLSQLNEQGRDILRLLDLMIELRKIFAWVTPHDYQLLKQHAPFQARMSEFFLTRAFHKLVSIDYLQREDSEAYEFDYRDPIHKPTQIVADFQKSVLLTFGRVCYDPSVLEYAEEIDVPGNDQWYERYVRVMKPWMDVILGRNQYVQWTSTKGIDVLESLYLFLFGFCLTDQLTL